ncbi:LpxL/LpxP family Kdo(2)-lipid IV(A) lauroyl/palmitoleoyl acyltransferase [Luteibacter yeojuensis]|uniref:Lipid A biosynthesis acyltransferase n=1 Tax=Luteibacter yeojuensis TaxID=345309 RepID=A0A0F3KZ21_9GAMM|nr:LpxL/LpxP family Kdo(2)-lipid IV(A) lauroyl/palmitoleoyl acyltransferase [Luteibacter yeojuensis]KJV36468.1 lipid A biosynthesis lauroyl acyltransferase [Luteibacter yeojuensis]
MPGMPRPTLTARLLGRKNWPAWAGVGVIWLMAHLPFRWLMGLGRLAGRLALHLNKERRRVAATNIALCFPGLSPDEQKALVRANLCDVGMMLAEFALGWMGSDKAIAQVPVTIEGLEHLEAARAAGRGVLLVGGHFSHLELCARLVSQRIRIAGMYRRMDSDVFEFAVLRARLHYAAAMFEKDDIRGTVKYLRQGGTLWYAPDQDMRSKDNVFAPFFGVRAATITATHHLARLSNAVVIPFYHRRLPDDSGYAMRLGAPMEAFPSADAALDTERVNQQIEQMVREAPEQYLWVHKRFKTRPAGEPKIY